jgi:AcrR family transcriptional regulator
VNLVGTVGSQISEDKGATVTDPSTVLTPGARRILETASALFYDHGIRGVGVDAIAAASGVTKRTLYDRFGSKDELVACYLRARHDRWRADVLAAVEQAADPTGRVLAPFDVLEQWVPTRSVRGCAFVNAYAELDDADHAGRAVIDENKGWLREFFTQELAAAGVVDREAVAVQLLVLHEGAMVAHAVDREPSAPRRARDAARVLIHAADGTVR